MLNEARVVNAGWWRRRWWKRTCAAGAVWRRRNEGVGDERWQGWRFVSYSKAPLTIKTRASKCTRLAASPTNPYLSIHAVPLCHSTAARLALPLGRFIPSSGRQAEHHASPVKRNVTVRQEELRVLRIIHSFLRPRRLSCTRGQSMLHLR